MKKIKLITPLAMLTALSSSLIPLASCSKPKPPVASDFETDSWSTICYYCNQGFDALKTAYKKETFVGLSRTVKINGQDHIVKVIGENHDTISGTNNKAALTFELFNLLSDKEGETQASKWDTQVNWNYTTSILHDNLNGGPKKTWTLSALDMLTSADTGTTDLKNNLKVVNKKVALSTDKGSNFSIKDYTTTLFPLSLSEINESDEYRSVGTAKEGEPYSYWKTHTASVDKKKGSVKGSKSGTYGHYKLTSPTDYSGASLNNAYVINQQGDCIFAGVNENVGVTFAFCI